MNQSPDKNVAVSSHSFYKHGSHRSNFIGSSVVMYGRKVVDSHEYRYGNEDFELWDIGLRPKRVESFLRFSIEIGVLTEDISDSTSSYETKYGVGFKFYITRKVTDGRTILNYYWLVLWKWWNTLEKIISFFKKIASFFAFCGLSLLSQGPI